MDILPRMRAWFCALPRAPRPVPRCGGPMGTVTPIGILMRRGVSGVRDGPGVRISSACTEAPQGLVGLGTS